MKIKLENFMIHKNLEVDFEELSIISGKNGSGKSTILHAINWLSNCQGKGYIKNGEKECSVTLTIGNDTFVRKATKYKTELTINGIVAANNKDSIELPLSFYSQFDKLFLLAETPKSKADILNEIFEIENLETGLTDVNKDIRLTNKLLEDETAELKQLVIPEDEFNRLYNAVEFSKELEDIVNKLSKACNVLVVDVPNKLSNKPLEAVICLSHALKIELRDIIPKVSASVDDKIYSILKQAVKLQNDIVDVIGLYKELELLVKEIDGRECPLCKQIIKGVDNECRRVIEKER